MPAQYRGNSQNGQVIPVSWIGLGEAAARTNGNRIASEPESIEAVRAMRDQFIAKRGLRLGVYDMRQGDSFWRLTL